MFSQLALVIFYILPASPFPLISRYLRVRQNTPKHDGEKYEKCSKMRFKTMPFSFPAVIFLEDSDKGI